jgi:hypothetical protein
MTRGFLRFLRGNTIALLALFVALGGTTYAATALPANSVGTKQLKKNAVVSKKVKNGALLKKDFKKGQLPAGATGATGPQGPTGPAGPATGAAGGDLTGNYPNPDIAANAVGGNEVDESTLSGVNADTLGGTPLSGLAGIGRQGINTSCNDDQHATPPQSCGDVTIPLPRAQRVLLLVTGYARAAHFDDPSDPGAGTDDPFKVQGSCSVYVDGVSNGSREQIIRSATDDSTIGWSFTWITNVLAAGDHQLVLRCAEVDGDIDWVATLSAVALAAD